MKHRLKIISTYLDVFFPFSWYIQHLSIWLRSCGCMHWTVYCFWGWSLVRMNMVNYKNPFNCWLLHMLIQFMREALFSSCHKLVSEKWYSRHNIFDVWLRPKVMHWIVIMQSLTFGNPGCSAFADISSSSLYLNNHSYDSFFLRLLFQDVCYSV